MNSFNFDNSGYRDLEPLPACMDIENIVKKYEYKISLDDLSKAYMEGKISAYTYSKYECLLERNENKFYEQIIFGKIRKLYYEVKSLIGDKAKEKVFVGAYDIKKGYIKIDVSDSYPPRLIHKTLYPRINKIVKDLAKNVGKINELIDGTNSRVGCCAEFRAVNALLNMGSDIRDIRLTIAFRYKEKGKLGYTPYCSTCRRMFQNIPHLLKRESECTTKIPINI